MRTGLMVSVVFIQSESGGGGWGGQRDRWIEVISYTVSAVSL